MKRLVELDAAVSALDGLPMDYGRWDVDDVLHALASVPTVDAVEVKHGRWIFVRCGFYKKCSECQSVYENDGCPDNFCPHCGAKMDGKDGNDG